MLRPRGYSGGMTVGTERTAASASHRAYLRFSAWAAQSPWISSGYASIKRAGRPLYRTDYVQLLDRHELSILFNRRRLLGCGVEVGVQRGIFSESLLDSWRGRHLISIDPWRAAEADYHDAANVPQGDHDAFYEETVKRLARFGERSSVWRMYGDEGAERIPHHSIDFVYLDARHDYRSVASDLAVWIDKVRPGACCAGMTTWTPTLPTPTSASRPLSMTSSPRARRRSRRRCATFPGAAGTCCSELTIAVRRLPARCAARRG